MTLWLAECAAIVTAHRLAALLSGHVDYFDYSVFCVLFAGCWLTAACRVGLWSFHKLLDFTDLVSTMAHATGYWAVSSVAAMYLFFPAGVDAQYLAFLATLGVAGIFLVRLVWQTGVWLGQKIGLARRRVLIVGADERTRQLLSTLIKKRCRVQGVLDDDSQRARDFGAPYLGPVSALSSVAIDLNVDDVYVGLTVGSHYVTIERIVQFAESHGLVVHILGELFQLRWAHSMPQYIAGVPVLALTAVPENRFSLVLKRLVDFLGSSLLLLLLSPAFLLVAILIKLDSRGPIFFSQERVGQNQRRFQMLKFRSMIPNAEAMRATLKSLNEASGPVFKIKVDPRVTRFGAFIRKHSIDEFPQLINVWRGEMSLVGPRPPLPEEVAQYTWDQRRRLSVKPGMTGLWQVSGRNAIDFEDWVKLDLQYIDRWTPALDFWILLKTFREVFQGRHAA